MEILIHGRNLTVNPRIQSYVEKKVERLDRYMPDINSVRVDLAVEKNARTGDSNIAQLTLRHSRGTILRAAERTSDLFAAIDTVVDKMYRQIERFKGRRRHQQGPLDQFAGYETAVDLTDEEMLTGKVMRRKELPLLPMHEEEAIEQLELLGHDFFVFMNGSTGDINILYKRVEGGYGVLVPQIA